MFDLEGLCGLGWGLVWFGGVFGLGGELVWFGCGRVLSLVLEAGLGGGGRV